MFLLFSSFLQLVLQHPVISGLGAYFLFSNLVGAMDEPNEKSGAGYRYVYRLGHGLAGNIKYALKGKFPEFIDPQEHSK